jgi:Biotin-requiring enzyme
LDRGLGHRVYLRYYVKVLPNTVHKSKIPNLFRAGPRAPLVDHREAFRACGRSRLCLNAGAKRSLRHRILDNCVPPAVVLRLAGVDNSEKTLLNDLNFLNYIPASENRRRTVLATPITAPMVGKILKVEKNVGDHVDEDDVVIVMEAMKMEIPVVAPTSGTLKELKIAPGQAVEADQVLGQIE